MLSVKFRWVGQTYTHPRCSASRENKPRIRRTKEERRTMVGSFIKKYQNLNNGKFPSLNLTHKEVGGSFYTIREIVRDIIQENKVLAPGNPTSKLLNLEYCSEDEEDKVSFLDVCGNESILTISDDVDLVHQEIDSLAKELEVSSGENSGGIKLVSEEISSNGIVQQKLVNSVTSDSNDHKITVKQDGASEGSRQIDYKIKLNNLEVSVIKDVKQPILLLQTACGNSMDESKVNKEDGNSETSVEMHSFEERAKFPEIIATNSLDGTNLSSTDCMTDQISSFDDKINSPSEPFEKRAIFNSTESKTGGSTITNSTPKSSHSAKTAAPISGCKEPKEIPPSHETGTDSYMCGAAGNNRRLEDKSSCLVDAISETQCASSKLLKPHIQEAHHSEWKAEQGSDAISILNGGSIESSSDAKAVKESEKFEANPIWSAIKAIVSAFVKFWSE